MTSANKNKAGGHSHPQNNKKSSKHQGDARKDDSRKPAQGKEGFKDAVVKEGLEARLNDWIGKTATPA